MTDHTVKPRYRYILFGLSLYISLAFLNGFYNPPLYEASVTAFWIVDILQYWVLPLLLLYYLYRHLNLAPKDYGLGRSSKLYPAWEMIGAGTFCAVILFFIGQVFWYLGVIFFGYEYFIFSFNLVLPEGRFRILVVLYMAITAGFVEEVMYRGLLWSAFAEFRFKRFKKLLYVVLSATIFAAVHWEQGMAGIVSTFGFGIGAAMFYLRLKNLWPMITAHTLVDIYYFW